MLIPGSFAQVDSKFVLLPAGIKFPPIEREWQKKPHSVDDAEQHLAHGGNVGIVAGCGYIGLDQDVPDAFTGIALPETTTWETRPGRLGMRFRCNDRTPELLARLGKEPDLAQFKMYLNGVPVGEIKLERTYQVIPPAIKYIDRSGETVKPHTADSKAVEYKMLKDIPPAEISLEWLIAEVFKRGISFSSKVRKESAPAKSPTRPQISSYSQMEKDSESGRMEAYAKAAFESEISNLRSAREGNRNIQLNEAIFKLAWFIEAGHLNGNDVFDNIEKVALGIGLEESEIASTMKSAYQSGKGATRHLEENRVQETHPEHVFDIFVNDRYLRDMTDEVLAALVRANSPPSIFCRNGELVRTHENGSIHIEPMTIDGLKNKMTLAAGYRKTVGKSSIKVTPPTELAAAILALDAWPGIREIKRVVETPTMRPDGSILSSAGYDEATQLYLDPIVDLGGVNIPASPTVEHAKASAKYIMDEIFSDFPFENEASKANVLALMLSVIVRPLIDGNVPMAIIDKPQAGTGASLMTDIIATVTTGKPASMWGMPESEDEWRKSITGALMHGSPIIVIDNVVGKLRSSSLTRALTSRIWRDRVLGKNNMIDLPQESVWIATGNNIQIGGDIARRAFWIRLDAACARPWTRSGFKHNDILTWIKENHDVIISYLIVMARAWIVAGKPPGKAYLGGFVEWSKIVGGILEFAGVDQFLGNATQLYDEMDQDVQQWDAFLSEWSMIHGDNLITARRLVEELTSIDSIYITFKESIPDDVAKAISKDRRASMSIGQVLKKRVGQVYPSGRKLISEKNNHSKILEWKVGGMSAGSTVNNESISVEQSAGDAGSNPIHPTHEGNNTNTCIHVTRTRTYKGLEQTPAPPAKVPMDSECQKVEIPANMDSDLVEVVFKTEYDTDIHGKMTTFKEGDKTMVAKWRAEAWQKRGIAIMDSNLGGDKE